VILLNKMDNEFSLAWNDKSFRAHNEVDQIFSYFGRNTYVTNPAHLFHIMNVNI